MREQRSLSRRDRARFGGRLISTSSAHHQPLRLLVIDPDESAIAQLAGVFHGPPGESAFTSLGCPCTIIASLGELHAMDLALFDVVICSTTLADASGLDALAYIQGVRADIPVILIGSDPALAIEAIRGGALDCLIINSAQDYHMLPLAVEKCLVHQRVRLENEQLHTDLRRSLSELAVTNQQLQNVIHQLESMARTDELTGLFNRRWFNLMLQGTWAEATRNNLPLACMMIDLDGFKSVNDLLGHHQGDDLLRLAAKVIRANCREVDVPARFGGDEFSILMPHTRAEEAALVAQRVLREFDRSIVSFNAHHEALQKPSLASRFTLSMSIGLSHVDVSRPINAEQLVNHADEAMYAAKGAGKRCVMMREGGGGCAVART
jgi:diguanylate cyclase (GGDEF)-like protein